MSASDRDRIAELLEDETRSFRSIGRELGLSDWLVRKTARDLYGDPRPMKRQASQSEEPAVEEISAATGWLMFVGFIAVLALGVWAAVHQASLVNSADPIRGFFSIASTERIDDETEFSE